MKIALITGITGQDGAYLAEFLINKNYIVHGLKRRSSSFNTERIDHFYQEPHIENKNFILHYGDMTDSLSLTKLIKKISPDEIYNLAAMSHVGVSFELPEYTANTDGLGALRLLESIRLLGLEKKTKIYQASTSELYGKVKEVPQNEKTPFYPRSPYAAAKLYAHWIIVNYREAYDIFACNGILFNHESPIRGETFVTRKITRAIGRIFHGIQSKLTLGNLDASRDWGFAGDFVEGMYMMMQHDKSENWVLATGESHTVKEFVQKAFKIVDLDWEQYVETSERYFRPNEVDFLLGDYSKAQKMLGWNPSTSFDDLVQMMVESDLLLAEREKVLIDKKLLKPTWEK